MSLDGLISTYGYVAIAVGTFFEGETVLILAGFASHQGYLELTWVITFAFLGTLCGDQLYFYLGRVKGIQALKNRPYWRAKSERVLNLLRKHQLLLTMGFRFLYGLRTVTPFLLGASGISPIRFLVLDIFGAFLWAVAIGSSGYLFGHVVELLIGKIERYELLLFTVLAVMGAVVWIVYWFRRQKAVRQTAKPNK